MKPVQPRYRLVAFLLLTAIAAPTWSFTAASVHSSTTSMSTAATDNSRPASSVASHPPFLRRSSRTRRPVDRYLASSSESQGPDRPLSTRKLLTAGILADIQYAPIPDGYSYSGVPRYYQHSLEVARHAAAHFQQEKVDLVINLGDLVDGKCQNVALHGGLPLEEDVDPGLHCVQHVMDSLSLYQHGPVVHTYGNHCLYNMDRETIRDRLGIPFVKEACGDLVGYHSVSTGQGVRLVVLDSYDIALMQRCEQTSRKRKQAEAVLAKYNPNYPDQFNSPEGLTGVKKRFVGFNGGVGDRQLEWLRAELQKARDQSEKVVILSHQPILPNSTSPVCLMWNYADILKVLRHYKDVVVASLSGHAHKGGYKRDHSGIHFRVVEAALENPHPHKTYAMMDVYDDRLEIRGYGNCSSAVYMFDHQLDPHSETASALG